MYDHRNEFLVRAFKNDLIENKCEIKVRCENMVNPQDNSILGSNKQVIANLVHTFDLKNSYLDEDYPLSGILADMAFAVHIKYYKMLQAMSGHLVFGRDMVLNTPSIYTGVILGGVDNN